jgi:hypothetical protein
MQLFTLTPISLRSILILLFHIRLSLSRDFLTLTLLTFAFLGTCPFYLNVLYLLSWLRYVNDKDNQDPQCVPFSHLS